MTRTMLGPVGERQALLNRLRRVEGQVRGLQRMVEDGTYCIDILTQVAAVTRAHENVALGLLDEHMRHCVTDAVHVGGRHADAKLTEASAAIARLVHSRSVKATHTYQHRKETAMTTQTCSVTSMTGDHCVRAVTAGPSSLHGASAVQLDLDAGATSTVGVTSASPLTRDDVAPALD